MAGNGDLRELIAVRYDREGDILTFSFTRKSQPAVAEEAAARVHATFGSQLTYVERADPQRLEALEIFGMLQARD